MTWADAVEGSPREASLAPRLGNVVKGDSRRPWSGQELQEEEEEEDEEEEDGDDDEEDDEDVVEYVTGV